MMTTPTNTNETNVVGQNPITDITNQTSTNHKSKFKRNGKRNTSNRHSNINESTGKGSYNSAAVKFRGDTEDMNGHVFQCHEESRNKQQFLKTLEALYAYINKNLEFAGDVADMCKDFTIVDLKTCIPADISDTASNTMKRIWMKKVDIYVERMSALDNNLRTIFQIIWGQCSTMMKTKLKAVDLYDNKSKEKDCIWLLKEIKGIMNHFDGSKYIYVSLDDATEEYYRYRQGTTQTLDSYYKTFKAHVEVLEHYGANVGGDKAFLIDVEKTMTLAKPTDLSKPSYMTDMRLWEKTRAHLAMNKATAISFLKRADPARYASLWTDLQNQYSRGNDQYPKNLTGAYELLLTHINTDDVKPPRFHKKYADRRNDHRKEVNALQFLQSAERIPGIDGITHEGITCFSCRQSGHYASACPTVNPAESKKPVTGVQLMQLDSPVVQTHHSDVTFLQSNDRYNMIPSSWILLDSQSTVSVFNNRRLLKNVRPTKDILKVYTNGGTQLSNQEGDNDVFGKVWYNQESLANILSLALVRRTCRVTYDSSVECAFNVLCPDGTTMKFREYDSGLYFFDTADSNSTKSVVTPYKPFTFIQSVNSNKNMFTQREIAGADRARSLYRKLGRPSEAAFRQWLRQNLIHDCPITIDDAKRALAIYGPDTATLKGKTTQTVAPHVPSYRRVDLPRSILSNHSDVALCIDFMFINGNIFFHSISKHIQFRTVASVDCRSKATIMREMEAILAIYRRRGLTVTSIYGDQEFDCIKNDFDCDVFISDTDSHVPEIERSIRVVKERVRATIHGMPFRYLPKIIIRGLVDHAVKCLNQFPAPNGISSSMSPLTLVTGAATPTYSNLQLEFGAYAQIFEMNDLSNTTKARTTITNIEIRLT